MKNSTDKFKPGDFVGYIYGQPGNDTAFMVVLSCDRSHAECYDPFFKIQATLEPKHLWHLSKSELSASIFSMSDMKSRNIGETLSKWFLEHT